MKYSVDKISVNSWRVDGSKCYDYSLVFSTWRALIRDMKERSRYATCIFYGKGADIFMDGELIGHTRDLNTDLNYQSLSNFLSES